VSENTDTLGDKIVMAIMGTVLAVIAGGIFYFSLIALNEPASDFQRFIEEEEAKSYSE
jgi:hypothetical protein